MNNEKLENWLVMTDPNASASDDGDIWDAGFTADRQFVVSRLGVYHKAFLKPDNFVKRFYHTVYDLPLEEWICNETLKLYNDFCAVKIEVGIRFQATEKYGLTHLSDLHDINDHIKISYRGLVLDIINRELNNLSDGAWVHDGLDKVEIKIASSIREMLVLQNIQSQVICKLEPSFDGFPDTKIEKENIYLQVLKKSYETNEKEKEELFRQKQEEEKQKIEHKKKQLIQMNEVAELDRQRLSLQAANIKQLLAEKEQQQLHQFEIKRRIHEEQVKHDILLKEMSSIAELDEKERHQTREREVEEQDKINILEKQAKINNIELNQKIVDFEKEQAIWREAKKVAHAKELEQKKSQEQLEFDLDINAKKRFELKNLEMLEENYALRKNADVYINREIELLELEKQRRELQVAVRSLKEGDSAVE